MEEISESVFLMSFERDFKFIPGQVIGISLDINTPPRLYSIASSDKDPDIKILFNEKKEGILTPWLSKRKAGDTIFITNASGNFICPFDEKAYWIAAGTGIAPFLSMYISGNTSGKIIVHGGRKADSFWFEEYFKELDENYIRCCSGESGPGLYHGRLTSWLIEQNDLKEDYKYYLCGSAEMVVETRDILIEKGITFDNIISEIYF